MKNGGASGPYSFHVGMASTAQGRAAVFRLPEAEPPPQPCGFIRGVPFDEPGKLKRQAQRLQRLLAGIACRIQPTDPGIPVEPAALSADITPGAGDGAVDGLPVG